MITALLGCEEEELVVKKAVIRPVKTIIVENSSIALSRDFPARVDAVQHAEVSFQVSGKLTKIHVKEGDFVEKGQLLAELDKTDYKITYNSHLAGFKKANSDFTRGKELIKDNYISQSQFDEMEAAFIAKKANLNQAKQELKYTELSAPFSGVIGKRYVENFENIQAKQEIFNLSDVSQLVMKIAIPEKLIRKYASNPPDFTATATFGESDEYIVPLKLKEIADSADIATQTFEATLVMDKPKGVTLLPGMTANVHVEMLKNESTSGSFALPVSAVKGASDMQPTIFIVDMETKKLISRSITVGSMAGSYIQVTSGIKQGEHVVVNGVSFLREGEEVSILENKEQATPSSVP